MKKVVTSLSVTKEELKVIDELCKRIGRNRSKTMAFASFFLLGFMDSKVEKKQDSIVDLANKVLGDVGRKNVIELREARNKKINL